MEEEKLNQSINNFLKEKISKAETLTIDSFSSFLHQLLNKHRKKNIEDLNIQMLLKSQSIKLNKQIRSNILENPIPKNIESKLEFKNEEDKLKYEIYEFFLNAEITGSNIILKDEIKKKLLRLKDLKKDK